MPPDDPAWPPGKNAVKRYIALRVWMMLQWADWMSASARFRCYTIQPEQCTSQVTDNVNEWDLSPTEWRYTPQPANIVTASSFEVYKWQIANMLRLTFDKLITHADKFSYSTGWFQNSKIGWWACYANSRCSVGIRCWLPKDFRWLAVSPFI